MYSLSSHSTSRLSLYKIETPGQSDEVGIKGFLFAFTTAALDFAFCWLSACSYLHLWGFPIFDCDIVSDVLTVIIGLMSFLNKVLNATVI